ncbi:MAG: hypothetical protein ABIJ81_01480 [Patescibacteria group bacterium]
MRIYFARLTGIILTAAGFFGFFIIQIKYLIQLDLWQSLVYLVLGVFGLYYGFFSSNQKYLKSYLNTTTAVMMIFLLIGLTFPNLLDLFHLEEEEHLFHAILFLYGVITNGVTKT